MKQENKIKDREASRRPDGNWLGSTKVHDYTVIFARQILNYTESAKDEPYFYEKTGVDLRQLTNQELNKLYLEAQAIYTQIQEVLMERG